MKAILETPPRTLMQVFKNLPEGTLAQLIEDHLVMSPAPLDRHQKLLSKLHLLLGNFIEMHQLGEIRFSPYDVYFDEKNAFQPDIVFISKERTHLIEEDGLHGAPDLVIEVLSPSNFKYDQNEKKEVYERCGVKEYWIVDPTSRQVQGFKLVRGTFEELPVATGIIASTLFKHDFIF